MLQNSITMKTIGQTSTHSFINEHYSLVLMIKSIILEVYCDFRTRTIRARRLV